MILLSASDPPVITSSYSPVTLSEHRVTHIVSIGTEPMPADHPVPAGISQLRIPVEDVDHADLLIHLSYACRFVDEALSQGGIVSVHCITACAQKFSRCAAVAAAYIMYTNRSTGMSTTDAINVVRRASEQVWIKPGFQEQLILFQLCQYTPSPNGGIYQRWRQNIAEHLR